MTQSVYTSVLGNTITLKVSQYTSDNELYMSLVGAVIHNGAVWLPKYVKTNRYQLVADAITKMVYASKVRKFLTRYVELREQLSARIIQRYWRRCIADPTYKMCYKRLMREFNELS